MDEEVDGAEEGAGGGAADCCGAVLLEAGGAEEGGGGMIEVVRVDVGVVGIGIGAVGAASEDVVTGTKGVTKEGSAREPVV